MKVLDLFSGIGGFSLGLERAGMRTVAFCEIDPYCQAVLRKHWPDVPVFGDVRTLTAQALADTIGMRQLQSEGSIEDGRRWPSVICGGFPCQDISNAGKRAGIDGERSGLWWEFARIIGEVRPRYAIVENVAALLGRGLSRVLGDLAALGYDAEWHCIPASAVGAPHRRDRLWIIAYPACTDPDETRRPDLKRVTAAASLGSGWITSCLAHRLRDEQHEWISESDMGRVANGVPSRVDRLRSLGNAVVPQIPEIIGRAIMSVEPAR